MANWAAGSSGVGPGVNKRVLLIMGLLVDRRQVLDFAPD
jgi:hypothetical protein